jgi:hypothetical protein
MTFAVFFGYWLNLAAFVIAAALIILAGIAAIRHRLSHFLYRNWLGFANAVIIAASWALLAWIDGRHAFAN